MNWFIAPVLAKTGREGTGSSFSLKQRGVWKVAPKTPTVSFQFLWRGVNAAAARGEWFGWHGNLAKCFSPSVSARYDVATLRNESALSRTELCRRNLRKLVHFCWRPGWLFLPWVRCSRCCCRLTACLHYSAGLVCWCWLTPVCAAVP